MVRIVVAGILLSLLCLSFCGDKKIEPKIDSFYDFEPRKPLIISDDFEIIDHKKYNHKNNATFSAEAVLLNKYFTDMINKEGSILLNTQVYFFLINGYKTENYLSAHYNLHNKQIEVLIGENFYFNYEKNKEILRALVYHEFSHSRLDKEFQESYIQPSDHFHGFFNRVEDYRRKEKNLDTLSFWAQANENLADLYSYRRIKDIKIFKNLLNVMGDGTKERYNLSFGCYLTSLDNEVNNQTIKTHPCDLDRVLFLEANEDEKAEINRKNYIIFYLNFLQYKEEQLSKNSVLYFENNTCSCGDDYECFKNSY